MTALVVIELPGAYAGIRSYAAHSRDQLQEHPDGDFKIGLKIFPDLRGGPPPLAISNDLDLADTLNVDAISIVVDPEAARGVALDSLARSIEDARADSTIIIVALGYPKKGDKEIEQSREGYTVARLKDIDRIARRLKPDYLIPAVDPLELAQLGEARGHRQRVARERARLVDRTEGRELVHDLGATAERADRQAAADHFT